MKGKHLAIQITENSALFVSMLNGTVINSSSIEWQSTQVNLIKKQIEDHFSSVSFLSDEFEDISLAWATKRSTLVPNTIFADSSPTAIFELCYGKQVSGDDIDYNRISELSIINVFEIPDWVKRFFVLKFPRIIIQHEGTHILRKIMHQSTFKTKATIVMHKDYFQLTIVRHNNLEFYSHFDYQSYEDILYHVLFALQQKELTNDPGFIEFAVGADGNSEVLTELQKHIEKIKDLSKLEVLVPEHFISQSQLLCV